MNFNFNLNKIDSVKQRLKYVLYSLYFIFLILFIKLSYLTYIGIGDEQTGIKNKFVVETRGDILDRNGNVIALNIPSSSVYLNPQKIKEKDKVIIALSKVFNFTKEKSEKLVNSNSPFVWVKRNVTKKEELLLKYYGLLGVNFTKEQSRFYPHGALFSHVLGITNVDGIGISGLERTFNKQLKNQKLVTSFDLRIQSILREALLKSKNDNKAKAAYGMVVNPNTSEVLAMVSLPDFNPNDRENINVDNMFNYPTQAVLEPGSIAKVFSVAMALDSGVVQTNSVIDASKPIIKGRYLITDYSYIGRNIIIPEILMYSSNIGSSLIVTSMGMEAQKRYLEKFGLFSKTQLEISEKEAPILPKQWTELGAMTISYGYGLAMSQATFMDGFVGIMNGGIHRPLTLLKRNYDDYILEQRVISEEVSKILRASLRLTVSKGFGKKANVDGYSVAGKTGSAEKQYKGKYFNDKVIASFLGFFPAYDPQYVILITIDEPKRVAANNYNITGGMLAAPAVAEIVKKIALINGIEPQDDTIPASVSNSSENIEKYIESTPLLSHNKAIKNK